MLLPIPLVLIATIASAQPAPPPSIALPKVADWIGTLEMTDYAGLHIGRTDVRLVFSDDQTMVTGSWRSQMSASGNIEGTLKGAALKLVVTMYGGAERTYDNGDIEPVAPERCHGQTTFTGRIYRSGVIRLTADRVEFDTPVTRANDTFCADAKKLIWLLQPHDH